MVQRQHRVRLAAAKVGLKLDHRIATDARHTPGCRGKQVLEPFSQVGAAEKLGGFQVLIRAQARVDLVEICRELGLLVSAAGHVLVRVDDLPPRLEAAGDRALDSRASDLALLAAHLLVEDKAAKLHLHLADFIGLGRGHRSQQPSHRVECPIRVVTGEHLLVRPLVALVTDLVDQAAFGIA